MILATGQHHGKPCLIVGLQAENVRLLLEGKPILKDLQEQLDMSLELLIFAGKDDEELIARMERHFPGARQRVSEGLNPENLHKPK